MKIFEEDMSELQFMDSDPLDLNCLCLSDLKGKCKKHKGRKSKFNQGGI